MSYRYDHHCMRTKIVAMMPLSPASILKTAVVKLVKLAHPRADAMQVRVGAGGAGRETLSSPSQYQAPLGFVRTNCG